MVGDRDFGIASKSLAMQSAVRIAAPRAPGDTGVVYDILKAMSDTFLLD